MEVGRGFATGGGPDVEDPSRRVRDSSLMPIMAMILMTGAKKERKPKEKGTKGGGQPENERWETVLSMPELISTGQRRVVLTVRRSHRDGHPGVLMRNLMLFRFKARFV